MNSLINKTSGILTFSDYKKIPYKILYGIMIGILFMALIITVFPPLWLFLASFKSAKELYQAPFTLFPDSFDFGKIKDVWDTLNFGKYYLNSFIIIIGAVLTSVIFNGLLAYAISILKPVGHRIVFGLVLGSLMIPPILNMGPLFNNIVKTGLINNYLPLMLVFGANSFYFILFKTYFDSLPESLVEAARLDGCNNLQVFYKIVLPLSKPIMMVVAIFTVNAAWSDFLLPYLVLLDDARQTVMVKIFLLQSNMGTSMNFGPDTLLIVLALSIIPPVIIFFIFQKQITSTVATTGVKE
jgi:multiple sugar transport system permease protein